MQSNTYTIKKFKTNSIFFKTEFVIIGLGRVCNPVMVYIIFNFEIKGFGSLKVVF